MGDLAARAAAGVGWAEWGRERFLERRGVGVLLSAGAFPPSVSFSIWSISAKREHTMKT